MSTINPTWAWVGWTRAVTTKIWSWITLSHCRLRRFSLAYFNVQTPKRLHASPTCVRSPHVNTYRGQHFCTYRQDAYYHIIWTAPKTNCIFLNTSLARIWSYFFNIYKDQYFAGVSSFHTFSYRLMWKINERADWAKKSTDALNCKYLFCSFKTTIRIWSAYRGI